MAKKKGKCGQCTFRAEEHKVYACDYVLFTGQTRKGQPQENCTYFRKGPRLTKPLQAVPLVSGTTRCKSKFDWKRGRELYDAGLNDQQIADALGCSNCTVFSWRKQNGLSANAARGWFKGKKRKE